MKRRLLISATLATERAAGDTRSTGMCNRYRPARAEIIEAQWQLRPGPLAPRWRPGIGPWQDGPFIRIRNGEPELVVGQWALIGDKDTQANSKPRMTNNARFESISQLKTYRGPWERGQRCVIPAESYDEPNWESGANVWWNLRRADGQPWHLAGLWNTWIDKVTGEVVESYTMVTTNVDAHPLLRRLHRPDPDRPPDKQDKRAVVPIQTADLRAWLLGTHEEAARLVKVPDEGTYLAGPAAPPEGVPLPLF